MALSPEQAVARSQTIMAHAWMVRTFVKHSPEVEDFPELMDLVRTVFDLSRALETRVSDPAAYLHMLRKKIGKLRAAAAKFRIDAPHASGHTNFRQAVLSIDACVAELEELLAAVPPAPPVSESSQTGPRAEPEGSVVTEEEDQAE